MINRDFHIHTTFSDGKCSPEELVLLAIEKGMTHIGFSDHSYTPFDQGYCMTPENTDAYKTEIGRLKKKYSNKIAVYLGIEQDYYSDIPPKGYDYIIGSVHYVKAGGEYLPVDKSAPELREAISAHFGGEPLRFAREYFRTVGELCEKTGADIIGHFDLLTKFSEKDPLFDTSDPEYVSAWRDAADRLLARDVIFEINTGAIASLPI